MVTTYKSKVDFKFIGMLFAPVFIVALLSTKDWTLFFIWLVISGIYGGFLYALCSKTTYTIGDEKLIIRILWMTFTIPIADVFHVRKDSYPTAGMRYGFAFQGLILVRQVKQVVFIAPAQENAFIEELNRKINSK